MAVITRRWARFRWRALAVRQVSPWRRKISASSSLGRDISGLGRIEAGGRHREWEREDQKHEAAAPLGRHFTSFRPAVGPTCRLGGRRAQTIVPRSATLTKGSETIRLSETRSYISGSVQNGASTDRPLPTFRLSRQGGPYTRPA